MINWHLMPIPVHAEEYKDNKDFMILIYIKKKDNVASCSCSEESRTEDKKTRKVLSKHFIHHE